jgi:hypothetical protein
LGELIVKEFFPINKKNGVERCGRESIRIFQRKIKIIKDFTG